MYQPQAIEWPERKRLKARAALSITGPKHPQPLLGTIELTLATTVDEAAGIVKLSEPQLISSHFPALDTQQAAALEAKIREALSQMQIHEVPLTTVLLSLKQLPVANVAVKNSPPVIFYADRPASLVVFDGEPVLVIRPIRRCSSPIRSGRAGRSARADPVRARTGVASGRRPSRAQSTRAAAWG